MKKMKKILCLLLVFAMTFGCMSGMVLGATGTKPADGVTEDQPFEAGTGGSRQFRIPCMVTLDDGTIVAGCDARWTTYADGGGLDTIVSYSKDNGETWNYTFANYLGDNGNVWNAGSTAFIDPAMTTDGETVYMIADLFPAGIALNGANYGPRTGSTGYDSNGNLVLAAVSDSVNGASNSDLRAAAAYDYHLEKIADAADDAESYYLLKDAEGNVVEGYTIDALFNIKGNGVDTNLFVADSPYFPYPTDFLYFTKSTDGGATWSVPSLLDVKYDTEATLLVCPGRALVTSTDRIVFPVYEHTSGREFTSVIYSDDGGKTWERSANMSNNSSEAAITEADGRLYLFTRHGGYYVSEDWGETWSSRKAVVPNYDTTTQLSAITYSEKVDGKTAILLSVPGLYRRLNGAVYTILVEEDGSLDWAYKFDVTDNSGFFAYSCLSELDNGEVGLLWEHQGSSIRFDSYTMDEILGYVKNLTIDPEEVYTEEYEADAAMEITQASDEKIATVTSEYVVEDSTTLLYDHSSNSASSLDSFSTTANVALSLEEAELVLTNVEGNVYKAYNTATGKYAYKGSTAILSLGTSADTAENQIVLEPTTADDGSVTYRLYRASDNARYTMFYNTNMDFNTWGSYNAEFTGPGTKGSFELTLLEKQEAVSESDVIPGYARATAITSGKSYLITYIWDNAGNAEDALNGTVFLLYPNANATGAQTKLVGDTVEVAKNVITITGVAPGKTTAVIGDVTYNITVTDPAESPTYAGNDLPTEGMVVTAGSLEPSEGSLEALLDGDESTFYHSNWSGTRPTAEDFWITIELPEAATVSGMRYLPRQGSSNGRILSYEISYSLDGETWTEADSGKWADDGTWKKASFEPVTAKYVKIFATDSVADNSGRHLTGAELRVVGTTEVVEPPVEKEDEVARISGTTRYETGYKVADALKEALGVEKFDAVVVATGKNFADALAGSYLAAQTNAPIILTNGKDDNVAQLHKYIAANVTAGGKVYILGGEGAVPATVEAIEGYDVVRLAGKSRYETNLAILAEAGVAGDEIIVATGKSFADSLSASAAKLPILLVKPGAALSDEAKAIAEGMKKFYIIGGEGAVSADIAAELGVYGEVVRVSGKSRYETSVAVANTFFTDVEAAVVASGKNFPDGLCGGPLAAAMNAPLILTADGKTDAAAAYMADNAIASGYVLGGAGALADDSVVDVFALESADEIVLK